ncbi:MAG: methyltransferase, partial [Gammaproteobacteria bacterium]|nr:methyltransferase [Gammaproteobacteria bacterium]
MRPIIGVLIFCLAGLAHADNAIDAKVNAALAAENRPAEDRERDDNRRPLETLQFLGLKDDMRV